MGGLSPVRRHMLDAAAAASAVAAAAAVGGLSTDSRHMAGALVWLKPLKFAISIGLYCATTAYLLSRLPGHSRFVRGIEWCTAVALFGELALITVRAARGRASHCNTSTPADAAVYAAMGLLAVVAFCALEGQASPAAAARFGRRLSALPSVAKVSAPLHEPGATLLTVSGPADAASQDSQKLVRAVHSLHAPTHTDVLVAGPAAELVDSKAAVGSVLPWALGLIALTTLLLFTGSLVVPLKALALTSP